jgi:hypothetical protein
MVEGKLVVVAAIALALAACDSIGPLEALVPNNRLTKAEIDACLSTPHRVGDELVSPDPEPHHMFKPGYNFRVKLADGSYGFGYQEASDGHLLVKYPKQGTSFDYAVSRTNGVVYFGSKATSCK